MRNQEPRFSFGRGLPRNARRLWLLDTGAMLRVGDNIQVSVSAEVSLERPDRFFLATTTKYKLIRYGESMLAQAELWSEVVRWRLGAPAISVAHEVAGFGASANLQP